MARKCVSNTFPEDPDAAGISLEDNILGLVAPPGLHLAGPDKVARAPEWTSVHSDQTGQVSEQWPPVLEECESKSCCRYREAVPWPLVRGSLFSVS